MSEHVFVYGTLREGDCRFAPSSFIRVVEKEAYLVAQEGLEMLDLGGFPGLVHAGAGGTQIRGEVHEFEHLGVLDAIEGYYAKTPTKGLYDRKQVTAEIPENETDWTDAISGCWVYTLNEHHRAPGEANIESGDWFLHKGLYTQARPA